ncbi:Transcriptional regulator TAC1 [Forsythia ovata]|uniref:Transcriptional regulator TAC1 n=1 Tax=Forsythia ovata TaxID=205694 RepID=A0ABD1T7H0_9LAMI
MKSGEHDRMFLAVNHIPISCGATINFDVNNYQKTVNIDSMGVERTYECKFCKRSFTNAQALGGHMNMHKKEKAEAKKEKQEGSLIRNKSNEDYTPFRYFLPIPSSEQTQYYGAIRAQMSGPLSSPSYPNGQYLLVWMPKHFYLGDGHLDANPSLRNDLPKMGDGEGRNGNGKENGVDLELRLGHAP